MARLRGGWATLQWDQSFVTRPVRPLLRMLRARAPAIDNVLPAAVFGRATWLGRMPADLVGLEILVDNDDPVALRFGPVRPIPAWRLWLKLLRRPVALVAEMVPCTIRTARGRANNVRAALLRAPLDDWTTFAARNGRLPEPEGFDRPVPPAGAPAIHFVMPCRPGDLPEIARTLDALGSQIDRRWTLDVLPDDVPAAAGLRETIGRRDLGDRVRVGEPGRSGAASGLAAWLGRPEPGWIGRLRPGDRPEPWAIAGLRGEIRARPQVRLLYTDSAREDGTGGSVLALKPGWSPGLLEAGDYVGGLCVLERSLAREAMAGVDLSAPRAMWQVLRRAARALPDAAASHLPRVAVLEAAGARFREPGEAGSSRAAAEPVRRHISIVMPTRDRVDLLRPAVESVLARTAACDLELVVADNGSADSAARAYLESIDGRRGTRVMNLPGPFNFSRIVNAAVATTRGEVVVLLNNDVEAREPGWLDELTACALSPGIGAVGAKLLYPDGRLQHAGIVLGWAGYAGHFGRLQPAGSPGHLGRRMLRHEVAAVTAACLAVDRRHFDAVGGFDESLAVAFNDVDFCLRLREIGLRNLFTPHAVLTHHESASRGHDIGPVRDRFREERRRFGERWRSLLQADPYFPLALSLNSNGEVLE